MNGRIFVDGIKSENLKRHRISCWRVTLRPRRLDLVSIFEHRLGLDQVFDTEDDADFQLLIVGVTTNAWNVQKDDAQSALIITNAFLRES